MISFDPFLSPSAIAQLQEKETQSSQAQKEPQNKSKLFIPVGKISWCQPQLDLEKPLLWWNGFLIKS